MNEDIKATPRPVTLTSTPTSLDGYTPKNQKLRTYPYCYLGFNPTGGTSKIYRYEDFENGTPQFNIISEINPNPQVAVIPQNYRGSSGNSLQDLSTITGYPTISWSVDIYNVWLAQNSNLINLKMENLNKNQQFNQARNLAGVASSLPQLAEGNLLSGISTAGSNALNFLQSDVNYEYQIKQQTAQMEVQQMLPDERTFWF